MGDPAAGAARRRAARRRQRPDASRCISTRSTRPTRCSSVDLAALPDRLSSSSSLGVLFGGADRLEQAGAGAAGARATGARKTALWQARAEWSERRQPEPARVAGLRLPAAPRARLSRLRMRIISAEDLARAFTFPRLIEALRQAFRERDRGAGPPPPSDRAARRARRHAPPHAGLDDGGAGGRLPRREDRQRLSRQCARAACRASPAPIC